MTKVSCMAAAMVCGFVAGAGDVGEEEDDVGPTATASKKSPPVRAE